MNKNRLQILEVITTKKYSINIIVFDAYINISNIFN